MAETYVWLKDNLLQQLGVSDGVAHLHLGLAIYVFVAFIMRMRLHSYSAVAAVVIIAFSNEVIDLIGKGGNGSGAVADIVNTILWPLVIFTFARARHEQMVQFGKAMRGGGLRQHQRQTSLRATHMNVSRTPSNDGAISSSRSAA